MDFGGMFDGVYEANSNEDQAICIESHQLTGPDWRTHKRRERETREAQWGLHSALLYPKKAFSANEQYPVQLRIAQPTIPRGKKEIVDSDPYVSKISVELLAPP